ncbi:MAG: HAD hydrolase-like protein, partial [Proteobacteria bacterium]|nr:HAD hydrolase-like protein [Pseudomonadota bacterium]
MCDGVAQTLAVLCQHYQCHIATNAADSTEEEIRMALQRGGIDSFISEIFCLRSLGFEKSSDDYFPAILSALNCGEEAVLMVGDSWEKDILTAQ